MAHSDQGIVKNEKAEEQPKDKHRAQTVHRTNPDKSVSREATRDSKADEPNQSTKPR
ncbi:MAG TPA: hypothetical protein VGM09_30310 [Bradyrhizobium sp.]|jgi:hypothetical protein